MPASRELEILTRAKVADLIPIATLKTRLGISGSTEDDQLAGWIEEMTEDFGRLTERGTLALQQYRETHRLGKRSRKLVLSRAPVEKGSITVTVDGTAETDFELQGHAAGILWREDGWGVDEDIVVTYRAGWIVPDMIAAWVASTGYGGADEKAWVRPTDPSDTPFLMEATTAGTSDADEPMWPTTIGGTVTDGTVVWTARAVEELPKPLRGLAIAAVQELREAAPRMVASERGATTIAYFEDGELYSRRLLRALERWAL